jgi:hypothetical protein
VASVRRRLPILSSFVRMVEMDKLDLAARRSDLAKSKADVRGGLV